MRIIGGTHRGRIIQPPHNLRARPTTDFAKEALFNILANHIDFEDVDVLDLFAGTGSIGYEFASRGAKSVTAVEINAVHYNYIKKTAIGFGFEKFYPVKANVFLYLKSCKNSFDVIFSDAPYDLDGGGSVVDTVLGCSLLNSSGLLIVEHGKELSFGSHPNLFDSRTYGGVTFSIFKS